MVSDKKQKVIDAVIEELKKDFSNGDYTVIDEILSHVPKRILIQSLDESEWEKFSFKTNKKK